VQAAVYAAGRAPASDAADGAQVKRRPPGSN